MGNIVHKTIMLMSQTQNPFLGPPQLSTRVTMPKDGGGKGGGHDPMNHSIRLPLSYTTYPP
jgi:hypothetical protein